MRSLLLALAAPIAALLPSSAPHAAAPPALAEPGISPDGREIAFVAGGDIWTVPATGGEARLLVSHPAAESRPLYSPDGKHLAFVSTRTGNGDVYVLTLATGELRRLTFDDQTETLGAWSPDGGWLYFHSTSRDVAGMNDVYRVRAQGGTPMVVSGDRYISEFFPAPHRDGRTLAVVARGFGATQWWRKGRSHLDESELWLVQIDGEGGRPRFEQLTQRGAKQLWPMWSTDGSRLYFVSDRGGAENLWVRAGSGAGTPITKFGDGHVLWPSISGDGRTIAFERDFGLWTLDTQSGSAKPIAVTLRGASAAPLVEHLTLTNGFQELALSPDGRKVAFVARGEIFAAAAKEGGDAARVTTSPAVEQQVAWSPDSRKLAYVSNRDGGLWHVYLYDFATASERQLTRGPASDVAPRWSPDGRSIAFQRGARELRVLDVASGTDRLLAQGLFDLPPFVSTRSVTWSPDSRWIAYLNSAGNKEFTNAWIVPAAGGEARPASELANSFASTLSWSPDGRFLLFDSRQRTEQGSLVRVDLVPRTPRFREDLFRDLFREEQPRTVVRAPQPDSMSVRLAARDTTTADSARASRRVTVDFEAIRRRAALLPTGVDVGWQAISPDGKSVLMIAGAAGQQNIYTYSLDEMARETPVARQITSTAGGKSWAQWSPDGREIYYLEQGRIAVVPVESRTSRTVAVTAEMDVDFAREKMEVFQQGWGYLRDQFFDPKFNGVDWNAQRTRIAPYIEAARSPDEVRRIMSLMIGDLNASHTGVNAPGGTAPQTGRLGLRFDRAAYERDGTFLVTEVLPLSPAALAEITTGSMVRSVDGVPLDRNTNLDSLLAYKIDRRVTLGLGTRTVVVRPVSANTEKGLLYRNWIEWNRAYVERASNGRLGYVHMLDMSDASLAQLHLDLDAQNHAKEGVVVDVRNNNGGFVNAYAIDVLSRRGYLFFTNRNGGGAPVPARSQLGQRALEAPTILLTNQHSLSDAEDFTEGYRTLKLGKVVGEPTSGWIVYTSNVPLLDGTVVRLPGTLVTTSSGEKMEMNPRPVDIAVDRPLGEWLTGRDRQLDTAVAELLKQLGAAKP